jgi:hypothetical protein
MAIGAGRHSLLLNMSGSPETIFFKNAVQCRIFSSSRHLHLPAPMRSSCGVAKLIRFSGWVSCLTHCVVNCAAEQSMMRTTLASHFRSNVDALIYVNGVTVNNVAERRGSLARITRIGAIRGVSKLARACCATLYTHACLQRRTEGLARSRGLHRR